MLYQHICLYMYCIFFVYNVLFFTLDLISLFIFHSLSFSLMNPMSHAPSHTFLNFYINTLIFLSFLSLLMRPLLLEDLLIAVVDHIT